MSGLLPDRDLAVVINLLDWLRVHRQDSEWLGDTACRLLVTGALMKADLCKTDAARLLFLDGPTLNAMQCRMSSLVKKYAPHLRGQRQGF